MDNNGVLKKNKIIKKFKIHFKSVSVNVECLGGIRVREIARVGKDVYTKYNAGGVKRLK